MTSSDLVFLIGRERSGTTVFRELLVSAGALNCDEILHGDLSRPRRFYAYVAERAAKDPQLIVPQRHPQLFREFVQKLRAEAAGRKLAIDMKYWALNLIPVSEDIESRTPFVLNYIRNNNAHVVHIVRRNKLRMILSQMMSQQTGKWSASKEGDLLTEKPKLTVEPDKVISEIGRLIGMETLVRDLLAPIPTAQEILYEEMFDADGSFSEKACGVACTVMGVTKVNRAPRNIRMNPEPVADLVSNAEALQAALSDTRHGWMMDAD